MSMFPRMIYQVGDQEAMHGGHFNYMTVEDQGALDVLLANGWYLTTDDAVEADKPKPVVEVVEPPVDGSVPTRAELESIANDYNIKFDGRTKDSKLLSLIKEAQK